MERRWGNRVLLDKRVSISRDDEMIGIARLHEASVSGAFLRTPFLLRNMTRIRIELSPSDVLGNSNGCCEAYVVRQCPDGVGIEWCEFGPEVIVALLRERELPVLRPEREDVRWVQRVAWRR